MHFIFYPRSMRVSDGLHYLIFCLLVQLFLGFIDDSDHLPIKFTRPITWLASSLGFLVLQDAQSGTLGIFDFWLLSLVQYGHIEGRCDFFALNVLWVPSFILRGIPSIVPSFQRFWRGPEVVWITWGLFLRNLVLSIRLDYLAVSLLLPGCLIHSTDIVWRNSCGIVLAPWVPSDKGAPGFLEGLFFF